jgi:hypothetical protein
MLDRRKAQRWPAYLGGKIIFPQRMAVADCLVRNISAQGAKLVVHNACFVPDEFELLIPCKRAEYRVRPRWRQADQMGVEIAPPHATDVPVPLSYVRRVKRLEEENERLKKRLQGE